SSSPRGASHLRVLDGARGPSEFNPRDGDASRLKAREPAQRSTKFFEQGVVALTEPHAVRGGRVLPEQPGRATGERISHGRRLHVRVSLVLHAARERAVRMPRIPTRGQPGGLRWGWWLPQGEATNAKQDARFFTGFPGASGSEAKAALEGDS